MEWSFYGFQLKLYLEGSKVIMYYSTKVFISFYPHSIHSFSNFPLNVVMKFFLAYISFFYCNILGIAGELRYYMWLERRFSNLAIFNFHCIVTNKELSYCCLMRFFFYHIRACVAGLFLHDGSILRTILMTIVILS